MEGAMNRHLFTEIKSKLKDRSGFLLMNIVLLLLVLTITVSSLSFSALANSKGADLSTNHNSVYYYAEGGLNEFGEKFHDYIDEMEASDLKAFTELTTQEIAENLNQDIVQGISKKTTLMNQEASRMITLTRISDEDIEVRSTANLGGVARTVSQTISNVRSFDGILQTGGLCVSHAMMVRDQVSLAGGNINGSVKITHPVPGSLIFKDQGDVWISDTMVFGKLGDNTKIRDIIKPGRVTWEMFQRYLLKEPKFEIEEINEEFPEVEMPEIPLKSETTALQKKDIINGGDQYGGGKLTIKFNQSSTERYNANAIMNLKGLDLSVKNVSLHSLVQNGINWNQNEFVIDVGDRDFNLILDQWVITSSVKVVGTGNLRIYVKDTPNMESKFEPLYFFHAHDKGYSKEKIAIILYNQSTTAKNIHIGSDKKFLAFSLIAENHNLEISPGPKYTLHAMLLGENNKLTTPASRDVGVYEDKWDLFFVPKGHISYKTGRFTGAIIAKSIAFENTGANITFKNKDMVLTYSFGT